LPSSNKTWNALNPSKAERQAVAVSGSPVQRRNRIKEEGTDRGLLQAARLASDHPRSGRIPQSRCKTAYAKSDYAKSPAPAGSPEQHQQHTLIAQPTKRLKRSRRRRSAALIFPCACSSPFLVQIAARFGFNRTIAVDRRVGRHFVPLRHLVGRRIPVVPEREHVVFDLLLEQRQAKARRRRMRIVRQHR
jgi:hypothetical protein